MKFRLVTERGTYFISHRGQKDEMNRLMELGFSFYGFYEPFETNEVVFINSNNEIKIEFNSLEELAGFCNEWGKIEFDGETITICN